MQKKIDFSLLRREMVEKQLKGRGIKDTRILKAFESIPRELFLPDHEKRSAYGDFPVSIGLGQTISQPWIVAFMTELLSVEEGMKVLEIGTGSGYQAAILAFLGADLFSIERIPLLAQRANAILKRIGLSVHIVSGDGSLGLVEESPFDRILVTAGAPHVPSSLVNQLKDQGRMVIPVGSRTTQELTLVKKEKGVVSSEPHAFCVFVPFLGKEAWPEE
ncbi:MAG: protein-L-isoaspartate(D-aspartate) O-methyltransferase [Candidatus Ratteibacteria bacterium]